MPSRTLFGLLLSALFVVTLGQHHEHFGELPEVGWQISNDYWSPGNDRGFMPATKDSRFCIDPASKIVCDALRSTGCTSDIVEATLAADFPSAIERVLLDPISSASVLEDMHHVLAIAVCRIGYNQNPSAASNKTLRFPAELSEPLLFLSQLLGREPTVGYAALVLDNCVSKADIGLDTEKHILWPRFDRWLIQRTITTDNQDEQEAHRAEQGFYAAHCTMEESFAPLLPLCLSLQQDQPLHSSVQGLRDVAFAIRRLIPALKSMRSFFEPTHFFEPLRSFLKCGDTHSNEVVFEGSSHRSFTIQLRNRTRFIRLGVPINHTGVPLRGPTGAMTTTLSFIDACLGVHTSMVDSSLRETMHDFKQFQPRAHAELIEELIDRDDLRKRVLSCMKNFSTACIELVDAYDDAVTALAEFRFAHADHIVTYILGSIPSWIPARSVTGTGGTPIVAYLCRAAVATLAARLDPQRKNRPTVSMPAPCVAQCYLDAELVKTDSSFSFCNHLNESFQRMEVNLSFSDLRLSVQRDE